MGWKASFIIINNPAPMYREQLLAELGLRNKVVDTKSFEEVLIPDNSTTYIGYYKENLIICSRDWPSEFFEDGDQRTAEILSRLFPSSEICFIILHSVVNLWGYGILKNGQKLRVRTGNGDEGTVIDTGEPLEEEKELLSKSTLGADGQRTYVFEEIDDEPMTEDQVGENFVFAICKRYFGEELDSADESLFGIELTGYKSRAPGYAPQKTETAGAVPPVNEPKPWYKFW